MNKRQYLIDEDTLKELLYASHKLEILDRDGVDNWSWYMEGRTQYLAECASMLPWNEGRSDEDLMVQIEDEDYYIGDLVDDQIKAFWEEHICPVANYNDEIFHQIYRQLFMKLFNIWEDVDEAVYQALIDAAKELNICINLKAI